MSFKPIESKTQCSTFLPLYGAHVGCCAVLYAYRMYMTVNSFSGYNPFVWCDRHFIKHHYCNMLLRWGGPVEPFVVSLPHAVTWYSYFTLYRSSESLILALAAASITFTSISTPIHVLNCRMKLSAGGSFGGQRSGRLHEYDNWLHTIIQSTKKYGPLSWFQGLWLRLPGYVVWYGSSIMRLHTGGYILSESGASWAPCFLDDFIYSWYIFSTGCLASAPFRNFARLAMRSLDSTGFGKNSEAMSYIKREVEMFRYGYLRIKEMKMYGSLTPFREPHRISTSVHQGSSRVRHVSKKMSPHGFLFGGTIRTIFRSCLPLSVTFAIWRQFAPAPAQSLNDPASRSRI